MRQPSHQVNETSHDSTEWGCCGKVCAKREVMRKCSALMSEDTQKGASVRKLTELDGKVFLWIDTMHRANFPFHLH